MPVIDLYSKRRKRLRGEVSDVYTYDHFSDKFRVQLCYMIHELMGDSYVYANTSKPNETYNGIVGALRREYGRAYLCEEIRGFGPGNAWQDLTDFILNEEDVELCLDAIELCYGVGGDAARSMFYVSSRHSPEQFVDDCIEELNARFREAGLGYELIGGQIIRIDSRLLHSEIVKPAIGFLNTNGFEGAQDEFLGAYEHYRHGNHEEALVDALKAFESTMKVILSANGESYSPRDTASKLVLACTKAGLVPAYNESHLTSLSNVLSSGIPTLRNQNGGHGQGEAIRTVEPEVVAYGLHLTAAAILMLAGLEAKRQRLAL
ncbi:STM4504/CBY_0614 family protein [Pseudomonas sp. DWRC2-2]|uniref:STM4504/CBY_0614 family protein n=1 Tax=Pseudomonas sp. DWRC2-2 TaxID=2804567 RepID=UPI003CE67B40